MQITTLDQLKSHLKIFKMRAIKDGRNEMEVYPLFCLYYDKYNDCFELNKEQVLETACNILI